MSAPSYSKAPATRRFGLRERLLLGLLLAALCTVLVAVVGWLSFQRVADSQAALVRDTLPAADALHDAVRGNARLAALAPRLSRVDSEAERVQLGAMLEQELPRIIERLAAVHSPHVEAELRQRLQQTAADLSRALDAMNEAVAERLALRERRAAAVHDLRGQIDMLEGLAGIQSDNATAFLVATLTTLLHEVPGAAPRPAGLRDSVLDVDIDTLERMHELSLTVHTLGAVIDRLEGVGTGTELVSARQHFAAQLALLSRRLRDIPDPMSRAQARQLQLAVTRALTPEGGFALRARELALAQHSVALERRVGELTTELDALAGELIHRGGRMLASASLAAERSATPGFIAFGILSAALLLVTGVVIVHIIRRQTLGRLLALEQATLALAGGQRDVHIDTQGDDELAALSRALERFRQDAIERDRLADTLRHERENLEGEVTRRTAELREANAALAHEMQEHDAARSRAEHADRAKTTFLGTLSHELRTPISGMLGLLELLQPTLATPTQQHQLAQIRAAATLLLELLEDMLDFARIEAGRVHVDRAPFRLRQAVDDVFAVQGARAAGRGLALVSDIAPAIPEQLVGDRPKLSQILLNLIGNAIKFSDEGVVQLRIVPLDRPTHLRFSVIDHGIGIAPEQQAEVFEPFVQVRDQGRHHAGTGLGLAVCKRLVQALGGRIELDSTPGAGTTVRFDLAFEAAPADTVSAASPVAGPTAGGAEAGSVLPSPGHPVLVVEDDPVNRLVTERFLELLGQRPLSADSVGAALQRVRETEVALALVDMNLPDGDGLTLLSRLRTLPSFGTKPAVLVSAHVPRQAVQTVLDAGFDAVLQKPLTRARLGAVLAGLLPNTTPSTPSGAPEHPLQAQHARAEGRADVQQPAPRVDATFLSAERDMLGSTTLDRIVAVFEQQGEALMASLSRSAAAADAQTCRRLAHKLRGSAANLGLSKLSLHAAGLEHRLGAPSQGDALQPEVEALAAEYRHSLQALRDFLGAADDGRT